MSKTTLDTQTKVKEAVREYVESGKPANTTAIAEYVAKKLGIPKPTRTTIGTHLRFLGYEPIEQPRWIWLHNGGRE